MFDSNSTTKRTFFGHWWSVCALCTALAFPAIAQNAPKQRNVNATDFGTLDIAVQDTDLAQVLQMLSIQSEKNIIAGRDVAGTVTANLYDVTFHEALEAVLAASGFRYIEDGNFIYVYTQQQYDEIMAARRKTSTRTFQLQYLAASDANEFIAPLLSDRGQSAFRGDVTPGFKPTEADGGHDSYAYAATLVVNDFQENLDDISALLKELDTEPQQVLVEATILQTELTESNAAGVDFSIIGDVDFADLTDPLGLVDNLLRGRNPDAGFQPADGKGYGLTSNPGATAAPGTFKIGIVNDSVAVFVKLLDQVQDTTVLARPKIMVLNRQRAEVLVGARVGYLSTTATETTTTQTVEFLDTGIQLVFRPFISPNGMVRMELSPRVSEASLRTVTDANAVLVTIPDEITNELTTNVRVRNGKTLVLGGLFREKTDISRRQVPLLGDIPVLGWAFRGQEDTVDRDEIIFMITPNIVNDEKLWDIGEDTLEYARAFVVGGREGLLPFSREKLTSGYNQNATAAFNRGDHDMALYYINNSLRLRPMQAEMIRFREKVTGAIEQPHLRSMMERVLKDHLHSDIESARMNLQNWKGTVGMKGAAAGTADQFQMPNRASSTASSRDELRSNLQNSSDFVEVDWLQGTTGSSWAQPRSSNASSSGLMSSPSGAKSDTYEDDGSAEDTFEVTEANNNPFDRGASSSVDAAPMNNEVAVSQAPVLTTMEKPASTTLSTQASVPTVATSHVSSTSEFDDFEDMDNWTDSTTAVTSPSKRPSNEGWSRAENDFYRGFLSDFFKAIGMPTVNGPATATTPSFLGLSQANFDANQKTPSDANDFAEAKRNPFEE